MRFFLALLLMPIIGFAANQEWIVQLKAPESDSFKVNTRFAMNNLDEASIAKVKKYLGNDRWLIKGPKENRNAVVKLLGNRVAYIESNQKFYKSALPDDPFFNEQWDMRHKDVGLAVQFAWDVTQGEGAVVAVIDTGVLTTHPELQENILPGFDFIDDPENSNDGDGRDTDATDSGDFALAGDCDGGVVVDQSSSWHGTHVAGTVAAKANNSIGVVGVAPGAKILPIRVLGKCGGSLVDIADAIIWAAGLPVVGVPLNPHPADVINLSLGGIAPCSKTMQAAIDDANKAGSIVVVAAGNDSVDVSQATPANCNGVITVASTDINGGRASYSNFGEGIDIAAPGGLIVNSPFEGIINCSNSGFSIPEEHGFLSMQGTSMAAPHVAGVVALMRSHDPDIEFNTVLEKISDTAKPFSDDAKLLCTESTCGAGIIDALGPLK